MQFRLRTSGHSYTAAQKVRLERIGFRFRPCQPGPFSRQGYFDLDSGAPPPTIDLPDLPALMRFVAEFGPLILHDQEDLEIYDDYRE